MLVIKCPGLALQCGITVYYQNYLTNVKFNLKYLFAVASAHRHDCQSSKFLKLTSQGNYISSVMAEEYGLGSVHCPWIIQVSEGQRINLTLLNFMHNTAGKFQMLFLNTQKKKWFKYSEQAYIPIEKNN